MTKKKPVSVNTIVSKSPNPRKKNRAAIVTSQVKSVPQTKRPILSVPRTSKRRPVKNPKVKFWRLMLKILIFALILLFIFQIFVTLTSEKTRVLGVSDKLNTEQVLSLVNLERAKHGLGPLSIDDRLSQAALQKGENMFVQDYWAHVGPDGTQPWEFIQDSGYPYQSAGENLARDFKEEYSLVAAWMASETHRANILNGNFSEAGLAVLDGVIGGEPVLLVVNLFAQPKTAFGPAPQVAIYDQNAGGLVLAGEIMPQGQLLARKTWSFSLPQIIFGLIVFSIVSILLLNLHKSPFGRRHLLS